MNRSVKVKFYRYALFWKFALGTFFADQITKLLIVATLPPMMPNLPGYDPESVPVTIIQISSTSSTSATSVRRGECFTDKKFS